MGSNEALNEKYRNELKAFYSVIKTCDQYIRFAFLTGVTKFSKISIFSDLNNLRDISMEKQYAGLCGITQTELETDFQPNIQALADEQDLTYQEALAALKQWYDGYLFHPAGERMYNPFSLLSALVKKEIKSYWFSTDTPTFLVNYLKEAHYYIPTWMAMLNWTKRGCKHIEPLLKIRYRFYFRQATSLSKNISKIYGFTGWVFRMMKYGMAFCIICYPHILTSLSGKQGMGGTICTRHPQGGCE